MAEVTSTPPPPGTQPSGGQGPQQTTGPRTATDGATADEHKPSQEQTSAETEKAKARFDPAVAVSPSLAHLEPGQEIRGDIVHVDGEGRPVLETTDARYALEPDAGLKKDENIAILIETVEKQAIGRLIEKDGERLETPVRVALTLVALHRTPEALPENDAARRQAIPLSYAAPTGAVGGTTTEFDFETSALALPESGIPAHGAAPGPSVPLADPQSASAPVTQVNEDNYAVQKGKKASATLSGSLLKATEQTDTPVPGLPGATVVYAQTSDVVAGQPATAAPSLPQAVLRGGPTQSALPDLLLPGSQLAARLVAATDGAPARQGLGNLKPGDAVTLTVLAAGAEQANLAQSKAFVGVITSAVEIASSAKDVTGLGLIAEAGKEPTEENKAAKGGPDGIERRAGERTGSRSDSHYIKSPAGAFLFRSTEKIAIGTKLTLAATPGFPEALKAPASHAGATPSTSPASNEAPATPVTATAAPVQETATPAAQQQTAAPPATPPQALPPLVSYPTAWPLVDEIIEAVAAAEPAAAKAMAPRISAPGARLSSGLMFFLSALRLQSPRHWIGEQAARALEAKGKGGLLNKLKEEFTRLARFSSDTPGADWRPFLIPLQTESGTQAIALLTRPHHEDGDGTPREGDGADDEEELSENQRFLLEIKLSALGPLQLDGLMRPERLDMVVRAGNGLTHQMRDDLRNIFESATGAAGLKGGLWFEPLSESPVDVARVLADALPGDHDARTLV